MIVITTPTGQIGGQVLENLLDSGEHLRLVARDPSGIPAGTRQLVEVIEGTPWAARAGYVTASLAMDDLIASTGVAYRALTNPSFMDNIAAQAAAIKNQGMFFSPIDGDRKLPAVATRDIAAAAARLLLDDSWSGAGEVPLLGPEDLSFIDMAQIMSEVLGKPVRFQQISLNH